MLHEFDNLGRRVKDIGAPAAVFGAGAPATRDLTTQYRYDAIGRLTRRIDANDQSTWYVYDAAGQLTHGITALGEVSESRYDAARTAGVNPALPEPVGPDGGRDLRRHYHYHRSTDESVNDA